MIKRPELKMSVSFLKYALGVTEKPAPFVALEVGTHSLKWVEVMVEGGVRNILGYGLKELSLPGEIFESQNQKLLQQAAKTFLKESSLSAKKLHLGFSSDFISIRKLTVPEMPKEELPQALRWASRSLLPFNVEESRFEFQILEVKDRKQDALIAVAPEEFLSKWVTVLHDSDFRVASVSSSPLSLIGWMKEAGILKGEENAALIDMRGTRTSLFILRGGKVRFIRDLDIGGESITQSLTQALATPDGQLKLDASEAERLKRTYGFPLKEQFSGEKVNASQMVSLMRPVLERLANEIKRSFDYYREGFGGAVEKIYLTGGPSRLKHLDHFLAERVGISIEPLPLLAGFQWDSSKISGSDLQAELPVIAPAFAVAFQEGRGLNLLPPRFREKKSLFLERVAMRVLSLAALLILLTVFAFQNMKFFMLKREVQLLHSSWKTIREIEALQETLLSRKRIAAKLKEGHPYLLGALKEIGSTLPPYAALNRISLYQKSRDLQLSGTLFGSEKQPAETLLGEVISVLEKSPFFQEVKLISTRRDETYDKPANNFEIVCRLKVH